MALNIKLDDQYKLITTRGIESIQLVDYKHAKPDKNGNTSFSTRLYFPTIAYALRYYTRLKVEQGDYPIDTLNNYAEEFQKSYNGLLVSLNKYNKLIDVEELNHGY